MARERITLFDTTLRDGAQTQGVDFSVHDKLRIAAALDDMRLDYIEGGWPGANPTDTSFFGDPPQLKHARFTAFGMTKRPGRSAANDPGLSEVLDAGTPAVCLVGKTWDYHVKVALEIEQDENIEIIADSIAEIERRGQEPLFDAEHFFDGFKANPEYAMRCLLAAAENGARWVVLCDTNGGTLPHEIESIVKSVTAEIPGEKLGIHAHNDTENAVANTLTAIRAGVRQAQGTINGLGERCGNANLISLIPTLVLKPEFADHFEVSVAEKDLPKLRGLSHLLDDILNRAPNKHQPYVGANAFAHKGGLHASAVAKDPHTYEHVDPEAVGNQRIIPVSGQSGMANITHQLVSKLTGTAKLKAGSPHIKDSNKREIVYSKAEIARILEKVKEDEAEGLSYEGAEASFELMAARTVKKLPKYFTTESYRVLVERRHNARGELVTIAEATVKLNVDGQTLISVGEGNGPINALDQALRKDLGRYTEFIKDLQLVDYKVRILNALGTEAVTRVMIESTDSKGENWFTVGTSPNIVDASYQALHDSLVYKLFRDGAPPSNS